MPLVELRGLSKTFGATRALDGVSLAIEAGEVHVLAGSNGAGKSTLIRILSGAFRDYDGEIVIDGTPTTLSHPRDAARAGIATIHQELSLVGPLSVADNLFLGEPAPWFGFRRARRARAEAILAGMGIAIDPETPVERLSLPLRQLVEIARALASGARVLVMDEPTSALGDREAERLFARIGDLRAAGCGILYISHRMEEIERLADRVSVLRDGRLVASAPAMSREEIVTHMVGRSLDAIGALGAPADEIVLEASDLTATRDRVRIDGVALSLRRGEILGLYGLEGSGASLVPRVLFGATPPASGRLRRREPLAPTPARSIAARMILLEGDRAEGLVGDASVLHNASLSALRRFARFGLVDRRAERAAAEAMVARLRIALASIDAPVWTLSGGNQQKVALARGLLAEPEVLLLDEPTRGIDVAAKRDIHALLTELAKGGTAVVVASSELDELTALCHRIVVFARGRVVGELARSDFVRERITALAMEASA